MKPLLNRQQVDKQLFEMWEAIQQTPHDDPNREISVQQATKVESDLKAQLELQDKALPMLWQAIHIINPAHPLSAAAAINANAERLATIIKSYSTPATA